MSTPSLLCVPYRLKAGTLYSQIPDSGLGDFVVTRSASNSATRVNSRGLIETVLDNVPRLDYPLGGITAGCPALLVEPLAQNQMIQSQDLSLAFPSQANTTPSANVSISPDGTQNADRLTFVTTGGYRLRNFSIVSGTSYTATLFYKNVDFTTGNIFSFQVSDGVVAAMRVNINPVTNTITQAAGPFTNVSSSIENYGNGWYRVRLSGTASSTGGGWYELVTNATKSIDLWGFQFETGLVATSYIPTAASPVTRGAETISKTGVSSLIGQTEGTIYAEVDVRSFVSSAARRIVNLRVDGSNLLSLEMNAAGNGFDFLATVAGVGVTASASGITTGVYKIAVGYNSATNGTALYVNGTLRDTKTVAIPNLSAVVFGLGVRADGAAGTQLNDRIRAHALHPTRLPNTGPNSLQSLTQ